MSEKPRFDIALQNELQNQNNSDGRVRQNGLDRPEDNRPTPEITNKKTAEHFIKKIVDSGLPMAKKLALVAMTTGIMGAIGEQAGFAKEYNKDSTPSTTIENQTNKQRDIETAKPGTDYKKQNEKLQIVIENSKEVMNMIQKQKLILTGNRLETNTTMINFDMEINGVTTEKIHLQVSDAETLELISYNSDGTIDTISIKKGDIVNAVTTRE